MENEIIPSIGIRGLINLKRIKEEIYLNDNIVPKDNVYEVTDEEYDKTIKEMDELIKDIIQMKSKINTEKIKEIVNNSEDFSKISENYRNTPNRDILPHPADFDVNNEGNSVNKNANFDKNLEFEKIKSKLFEQENQMLDKRIDFETNKATSYSNLEKEINHTDQQLKNMVDSIDEAIALAEELENYFS